MSCRCGDIDSSKSSVTRAIKEKKGELEALLESMDREDKEFHESEDEDD